MHSYCPLRSSTCTKQHLVIHGNTHQQYLKNVDDIIDYMEVNRYLLQVVIDIAWGLLLKNLLHFLLKKSLTL